MNCRDTLAEEFAGNVVIKRKEDFAIIVGKDSTEINEKKLRTEKLAKHVTVTLLELLVACAMEQQDNVLVKTVLLA